MVVLPAPLPETTRTSYESVAGATRAYDVRLLPGWTRTNNPAGRPSCRLLVGER